ncbi:MAG: ABC transporter permease [Actinobacteria bacterium]|nr:ABC transporter permease [Actinomycetota bacterium]
MSDGGDRRVAAIVERVTGRQHRSTLFAGLAVTAFLVFFANEFWRPGQSIGSDDIIRFLVIAIVYASIYAIAAAGLVVTYTTSGIFNFAQGAMGMFFAFIYWQMKAGTESGGWGLPAVPSLIIVIFVIAPVLGALIERLIMRGLADAPLVAKLVATIGLLAFFIGLADIIWSRTTYRTIGTFFGQSGISIPSLASSAQVDETFVQWWRIITIVIGIAIAILLRMLFYRTRIGIAMRAVVDNRELAALNGANPGRVSMAAWAVGASMAAIAGILIAQAFTSFDSQVLTLFIIEAFAAAIIGRLRSLPMTLVGGLVIGLALSFKESFLAFDGRWESIGRQGVIPGIILFAALLFLPQARIEGRKLAKAVAARVPSMRSATVGFVIFWLVVVVVCALMGDSSSLIHIEAGVVIAFIMLSLVPLTGWAGQISFAQVTFAGFGAWAGYEFSHSGGAAFGLDFFPAGSPLALVMAVVVAVPIGLLMALPALRLHGLYLALASMAFALMAPVIFYQPEVFSNTGVEIDNFEIFGGTFGRPFEFLGIHFGQDAALTMFTAALFGLVGIGVVALRRGSFGRRLIAMRDSEAACATLGVNLRTTKLAVFGLSAGIAGMGGALFGIHVGNVDATSWHLLTGLDGAGLALLLLMVVGGVGVASGAVFGASTLQIFTKFLPTVWFPTSKIINYWSKVGPGLAGIGIARQPEGVIPQVGHDLREKKRLREAKKKRESSDSPTTPAPAEAS